MHDPWHYVQTFFVVVVSLTAGAVIKGFIDGWNSVPRYRRLGGTTGDNSRFRKVINSLFGRRA